MIVDAVGVTESELVDTVPLDRKPTVPLETLLKQRLLRRPRPRPDVCSAIAARLDPARPQARARRARRSSRSSPAAGASRRSRATSSPRSTPTGSSPPPGRRPARTSRTSTASPPPPRRSSPRRPRRSRRAPTCAERIVEVRRLHEQAIDETSADELLEAGYSAEAADRARRHDRVLGAVLRGATATRSPPSRSSTPAASRSGSPSARSRSSRRRSAGRRTSGRPRSSGRPTSSSTARRCAAPASASSPTSSPSSASRSTRTTSSSPTPTSSASATTPGSSSRRTPAATFTAEQLAWLERIRDHVAAALAITADDFAYTPFVEAGGLGKAAQVFGDDLAPLLDEINEVLAA